MKTPHRSDAAMDDYLATLGLWRKPTAKDGSCLFRAVSEQLFHTQAYHLKIRQACIRYMERHREQFEAFVEGPFDHHLHNLRNPKEWAGQVEITALSQMFKRDFVIYQEVGKSSVNVTQNAFKEQLALCFSNGNHYDSIYPRSFVESQAMCQSIVYELLYKQVFHMEDPVEKGLEILNSKLKFFRQDSLSSNHSDKPDSPSPEWSAEVYDNDVEVDINKDQQLEKYERKSVPFPYKVAKSLAPDIYRNVELDAWLESKKEQHQRDFGVASDLQFCTGDKCQITLEDHPDRVFNAHIQEMSPDKGPVTVFVEELGERHKVAFSNLIALPQNYSSQGWTLLGGKTYKHLSGYYQKAPLNDLESPTGGRKKRGKRKEVPLVIPITFNNNSTGRGRGLPPRLQHQQGDMAGKGFPPARSNQGYKVPGSRQESFHFVPSTRGRSGGFYKSGQQPFSLCYSQPFHNFRFSGRGRQRSNSAGHYSGGDTGADSASSDQSEQKISTERSPSMYDIHPRDAAAFPALPNHSGSNHVGGRPDWHHRRNQDGEGASGEVLHKQEAPDSAIVGNFDRVDNVMTGDLHNMGGVGGPSGYGAQSSTPPSCSASPITTPANIIPQGGAAAQPPTMVLSPGNLPFYSCLAVPHLENITGPINYNAAPSTDPNGADLPRSDPSTLRFFFNLGLEYYRMSSYMQIQQQQQQQYAMYMSGQQLYPAGSVLPPGDGGPTPEEERNGQCCQLSSNAYPGADTRGPHGHHNKTATLVATVLPNKREVVYVDTGEEKDDKCDCQCHDRLGGHDSGCISDVSSGGNDDSNLPLDSTIDRLSRGRHCMTAENSDNHSDSSSQHSLSNVSSLSTASEGRVTSDTRLPSRPVDFIKPKRLGGAPPKLARPLKDIPPRFQKLLAEASAAKAARLRQRQLEGPPLMKQGLLMAQGFQLPPQSDNNMSSHVFNPNAQSFVPGRPYECDVSVHGYCTNFGMQYTSCERSCPSSDSSAVVQPDTVDNPNPSGMVSSVPTYTIHISNNSSSVDGSSQSSSVLCSNPVPLPSTPAGQYASSSAAGSSPPQGAVYYPSQLCSQPPTQSPYVQYVSPVPQQQTYIYSGPQNLQFTQYSQPGPAGNQYAYST